MPRNQDPSSRKKLTPVQVVIVLVVGLVAAGLAFVVGQSFGESLFSASPAIAQQAEALGVTA